MASQSIDTFHTASSLDVGDNRYQIYRLESLAKETSLPVDRLPFSLKILLETPAPVRGRPARVGGRHPGAGGVGRGREA